jgi:hypothetical protein
MAGVAKHTSDVPTPDAPGHTPRPGDDISAGEGAEGVSNRRARGDIDQVRSAARIGTEREDWGEHLRPLAGFSQRSRLALRGSPPPLVPEYRGDRGGHRLGVVFGNGKSCSCCCNGLAELVTNGRDDGQSRPKRVQEARSVREQRFEVASVRAHGEVRIEEHVRTLVVRHPVREENEMIQKAEPARLVASGARGCGLAHCRVWMPRAHEDQPDVRHRLTHTIDGVDHRDRVEPFVDPTRPHEYNVIGADSWQNLSHAGPRAHRRVGLDTERDD